MDDHQVGFLGETTYINGNETDNDTINLIVDNTESFPTAVEILYVIFQDESFLKYWTQNSGIDFSHIHYSNLR